MTTGACARPKDLYRVARGQPSGAVQVPQSSRQGPSVGAKPLRESSLRSGASLRKSTLVDGLATPSEPEAEAEPEESALGLLFAVPARRCCGYSPRRRTSCPSSRDFNRRGRQPVGYDSSTDTAVPVAASP